MATTSQNKKNEMENQVSNVIEQAKGAAENVKDKAKQAGEYVRDKADQAVSSTGKGMESLASTVRDRGPQEGILGKATAGVADTLDRTGQYLDEHGVSGMVDDLTSMIKNHPLPAILIGVGIGFMLARLTTSTRS
jgi:ElaB/YqjD/DUF883 family membrane-anchored ribosome-binding protein